MELLAIYKQDMTHAKCSPNRKSNIAKARKAQPLIITPFFLLWQGSPACLRKLFRQFYLAPEYASSRRLAEWNFSDAVMPARGRVLWVEFFATNATRAFGWVVGPWKANLETTVPPHTIRDWRSMLPRGRGW